MARFALQLGVFNEKGLLMYARIAAMYVRAYCRETFEDPGRMESTVANGEFADVFDHVDHGSHKYIPADRLSEELGMRPGAGVFAYWKMADGSYLLRTCPGPLAYWSGRAEDRAEWPSEREKKI